MEINQELYNWMKTNKIIINNLNTNLNNREYILFITGIYLSNILKMSDLKFKKSEIKDLSDIKYPKTHLNNWRCLLDLIENKLLIRLDDNCFDLLKQKDLEIIEGIYIIVKNKIIFKQDSQNISEIRSCKPKIEILDPSQDLLKKMIFIISSSFNIKDEESVILLAENKKIMSRILIKNKFLNDNLMPLIFLKNIYKSLKIMFTIIIREFNLITHILEICKFSFNSINKNISLWGLRIFLECINLNYKNKNLNLIFDFFNENNIIYSFYMLCLKDELNIEICDIIIELYKNNFKEFLNYKLNKDYSIEYHIFFIRFMLMYFIKNNDKINYNLIKDYVLNNIKLDTLASQNTIENIYILNKNLKLLDENKNNTFFKYFIKFINLKKYSNSFKFINLIFELDINLNNFKIWINKIINKSIILDFFIDLYTYNIDKFSYEFNYLWVEKLDLKKINYKVFLKIFNFDYEKLSMKQNIFILKKITEFIDLDSSFVIIESIIPLLNKILIKTNDDNAYNTFKFILGKIYLIFKQKKSNVKYNKNYYWIFNYFNIINFISNNFYNFAYGFINYLGYILFKITEIFDKNVTNFIIKFLQKNTKNKTNFDKIYLNYIKILNSCLYNFDNSIEFNKYINQFYEFYENQLVNKQNKLIESILLSKNPLEFNKDKKNFNEKKINLTEKLPSINKININKPVKKRNLKDIINGKFVTEKQKDTLKSVKLKSEKLKELKAIAIQNEIPKKISKNKLFSARNKVIIENLKNGYSNNENPNLFYKFNFLKNKFCYKIYWINDDILKLKIPNLGKFIKSLYKKYENKPNSKDNFELKGQNIKLKDLFRFYNEIKLKYNKNSWIDFYKNFTIYNNIKDLNYIYFKKFIKQYIIYLYIIEFKSKYMDDLQILNNFFEVCGFKINDNIKFETTVSNSIPINYKISYELVWELIFNKFGINSNFLSFKPINLFTEKEKREKECSNVLNNVINQVVHIHYLNKNKIKNKYLIQQEVLRESQISEEKRKHENLQKRDKFLKLKLKTNEVKRPNIIKSSMKKLLIIDKNYIKNLKYWDIKKDELNKIKEEKLKTQKIKIKEENIKNTKIKKEKIEEIKKLTTYYNNKYRDFLEKIKFSKTKDNYINKNSYYKKNPEPQNPKIINKIVKIKLSTTKNDNYFNNINNDKVKKIIKKNKLYLNSIFRVYCKLQTNFIDNPELKENLNFYSVNMLFNDLGLYDFINISELKKILIFISNKNKNPKILINNKDFKILLFNISSMNKEVENRLIEIIGKLKVGKSENDIFRSIENIQLKKLPVKNSIFAG